MFIFIYILYMYIIYRIIIINDCSKGVLVVLLYSYDIIYNMKTKTCPRCNQTLPEKQKHPLDTGVNYKLIPNLDSPYYVSDTGLVYSTNRQRHLRITNYCVYLPCKQVQKCFKVSYLVARAFFPNYDKIDDPYVDHKDGDRANNHISNLNVF